MRTREQITEELLRKEERVRAWEQKNIDHYVYDEPRLEYLDMSDEVRI
jgi:hypothetical protein